MLCFHLRPKILRQAEWLSDWSLTYRECRRLVGCWETLFSSVSALMALAAMKSRAWWYCPYRSSCLAIVRGRCAQWWIVDFLELQVSTLGPAFMPHVQEALSNITWIPLGQSWVIVCQVIHSSLKLCASIFQVLSKQTVIGLPPWSCSFPVLSSKCQEEKVRGQHRAMILALLVELCRVHARP